VAEKRAGHDISITVNLNAGVPVEEIRSSSHDFDQINLSPNTAKITLRDEKTIPNKDFILRYDVTGKRIEDAVLTHRDDRGGFFTLILQPPDKIASEDRTPKEIVFVLDTSGSMSGFPIEKAKEAMKLSLDGLYPEDTFNVITFAGDTAILFDRPVPATRANLDAAQQFLAERQGYGGTEMMKAIKASLEPSDAADHLRVVCFMTDGEVGNDDEIIAEVQRHPNARVFSFGIGNSVNRSLLDKIAQEGRGESEYVSLSDDGSKAARKFYERVRTPLLTDLSIDWNGMPVTDVFPGRLTDLFSAKPVILHGRYGKAASGTIRLKGKVAGQPYERSISLNLPDSDPANEALASLWARTRIDDLSSARLKAETPAKGTEIETEITNLGLQYRLLTQFTSFVAVEDRVVNQNGTPVTIQVPVELPDGMDRQETFSNATVDVVASGIGAGNGTGGGGGGGGGGGSPMIVSSQMMSNLPASPQKARSLMMVKTKAKRSRSGTASGSGTGYGSLGTVSATVAVPSSRDEDADGNESTFIIDGAAVTGQRTGTDSTGVLNGKATNLPKPDYPAAALAVNAHGTVDVQITVGTNGKVESAKAISGHPFLRAAAVKAAFSSEFVPITISGTAIRVSGVIVYRFVDARGVTPEVEDMKVDPPSPAEKRLITLAGRSHGWIYAVVQRLQKGETSPTPNESLFVHNGKADIQIELTSRSTEVLNRLAAAGFEFVQEKGKAAVIGRIPLDKLAALAEIDEVKLILPKM
jgi:TonB family protein